MAGSELVGRGEVLAQLAGAVEDAAGGRGGLLLLTGEAGIGKSAVVGEAAAAAQGRGAWVAWGWGWQGERTPAYWPWMQVFRSPAAQDGQLRRLFAALARRQADVDRFLGVMTGAVPLAEFFAARNMLRLLGVRGLAAMALRGRRQAAAG